MPQNRSGFLVMTSGPGWMPWMIMAPTISAITALDGMPSVSIGNERGLRRGVVGRFGRRHALDGALAESLRVSWRSSSPAYRPRRRRGSGRRRAARRAAEPSAVPRMTAGIARRDLLARRPQRADLDGAAARARCRSRLTTISAMPNRPMAIGAKSMPSRELGNVEGEALGAGVDVGADQAEQQAEEHHGDRLDDRAAGQHDGGDQAERHQRAVVGRAEFLRHARQRFGEHHDDDRADGAGEERADAPRSTAPRRRGRCAPSGSRRGRSRPTRLRPAG